MVMKTPKLNYKPLNKKVTIRYTTKKSGIQTYTNKHFSNPQQANEWLSKYGSKINIKEVL